MPKPLPHITAYSAIDRLELSAMGDWEKGRFNDLLTLSPTRTSNKKEEGKPADQTISLCGQQVRILQGGKHGPDFYPVAIEKPHKYRLSIFKDSPNNFATRITIYPKMLHKHTTDDSISVVKRYLADLGLRWKSEQLSRIDLCSDVAVPFHDFRSRMEEGCFACRAKGSNLDEHDSTMYLGSRDNLQLRIYDKAAERKLNDTILTRSEFQLQRKWLRSRHIDTWKDMQGETSNVWQYLTNNWFRFYDRRPDKKHYDRIPVWRVWQAIQNADTFN